MERSRVRRVTRLEFVRREKALTQEELAELAQVSVRAISDAEGGGSPRRATAAQIALALGRPVDELFPTFKRAA
jgi:transcriptional regulator with XRE-family HTH domain